jgi:hypothetical protein
MYVEVEEQRFLRCRCCKVRKDPKGGRHIKRVKVREGVMMKVSEFYCADCVAAGQLGHNGEKTNV